MYYNNKIYLTSKLLNIEIIYNTYHCANTCNYIYIYIYILYIYSKSEIYIHIFVYMETIYAYILNVFHRSHGNLVMRNSAIRKWNLYL